MSKFNFDSEFFRRVISNCKNAEKIPSLSQTVKKAVEVFYDEYDYYPDLAVYAPGTFTIMGDHLEYVKGTVVQAALPLGAVMVGKSLCSAKCKIFTTSKNVEGLRKSVFPLSHYKKGLKVFPEWVNYIKGIINNFPHQDIKGFDIVIQSNVPVGQGYGSSAALQVGFYTFLEAVVGEKLSERKDSKGALCYLAESQQQLYQDKLGLFNNFTSATALPNNAVKINCRTKEVSTFGVRDLNILFLLIYPNFEIELNDREYVERRKMELNLAAKLLELEEIIDVTEHHLNVLETMEDPTKEKVIDILRSLGYDEESIKNFVEDLFYFPSLELVPEDYLEPEYILDTESHESNDKISVQPVEEVFNNTDENKSVQEEKHPTKPPPRITELCAGNVKSETSLPQRICEEINCLGGIDNLSAASDLTVCGKLLRRVRHVFTENQRSLTLSDVTSQVDYEEFGSNLIQSHLSLKIDYEVSCPTLDGLVQLAIDSDKVFGAKMMSGGGVLVLLHRSVAELFIEQVKEKFKKSFQFYLVFPSSGARILNIGVKDNPKSSLSDVLLNRDQLIKSAIENFEDAYKYRPTHGAYSPGIISFVGDFNDYNHGFCLSLAGSMMTVVVGALNGTTKIRAITTEDVEDEKNKVIFSVFEGENFKLEKIKWARVLKGVISHFKGNIKGCDCLIESTLPFPSDVSAKSALTTAFYTFLEVFSGEEKVSAVEKARRCMLAVQELTNIVYGINESIVATRARENFFAFVDCRSTATTLIPFQDPSVIFLLTFVELKVKLNRALLYVRMEECYEVAKALGGRTLRCLSLKDLEALKSLKKKIPEKSVLRAIHIITENERVLKAAEALKNHDFDAFGEIMIASHNSLRDNFEIVNPELDRLVASAMEVDGVLGSKALCNAHLTCITSLVKRWAVDDLIEYLQKSTTRKLISYVMTPSDGCNSLDLKEYLDKLSSPQFGFEHVFPF